MVDDRFCCFRVHTIGMVLGWLCAIWSIISIVTVGFLLGYLDQIVEEFMKNNPNQGDYEHVRAAFLVIFVVALILSTIHLVASLLLIAGTVKNKHLLLLPWLINGFVGLLFQFISIMVVVISGIHSATSAAEILKMTFPVLLSFVIQMTIWSAIYKLFHVIRYQTSLETQRLLSGPTAPGYTRL